MKEVLELVPQAPAAVAKPGPFIWLRDIDRLLRGDATRLSALGEDGIQVRSDRLQWAIVLLGMGYGICMGAYALFKGDGTGFLQLLSGMVKVPALFLLTLLVTFPSLYVFNALVGSRLSLISLWRLLTSSVALNIAVLASFGPVVAFFSLSTSSYSFMLLLNVLVFGAAGVLGLKFLLQTLHRLTVSQPAADGMPPVLKDDATLSTGPLDKDGSHVLGPQVKAVFRCWVIVFGLVGAQMSWLLRPFLGSPDQPFSFFRSRDSNFFEAVWNHLVHLFGG